MQPRIRCAVCDKTVETLEWWDDRNTGDRIIKVYCHGDTDQMTLSMDFLIKLNRDFLPTEGEAFTTKRIEK